MLMFSKSDDNETQTSGSPILNMISEGTILNGNIESESDIRISGTIEGEAHSTGRIIVTAAGSVNGNIKAEDADIAGKLDGELFISGKLILRSSAVVTGDIHTKTLLVEEGAQIRGNCNMSSNGQQASHKPEESDNSSFSTKSAS